MALSEAGAHLGQNMSTHPYFYAAGTFSRSLTQVLVLLRKLVLFAGAERGSKVVRDGSLHACVWMCESVW